MERISFPQKEKESNKEKEKLNTVATVTAAGTNNKWELLYSELSDLVNDQFRAWYFSRFASKGEQKIRQLAGLARAEGLNPPRYFSLLLKQE